MQNREPSKLGFALIVSAIVFAAVSFSTAEVREQAAAESFKSGGQQSAAILNEIANTLQRIDARLARFERALAVVTSRPRQQQAE